MSTDPATAAVHGGRTPPITHDNMHNIYLTFSQPAVKMWDLISLLDVFVCMTGWLCDDSVLLMTRLNIGDWFQCNLDQLTLWQHAKLHDIIITITTTLPVQHSQAELMDSLGVKLERRQLITKAVQCVKHSTILQWLQILLLQQQKLHLLTQHNTAKLHQH